MYIANCILYFEGVLKNTNLARDRYFVAASCWIFQDEEFVSEEIGNWEKQETNAKRLNLLNFPLTEQKCGIIL